MARSSPVSSALLALGVGAAFLLATGSPSLAGPSAPPTTPAPEVALLSTPVEADTTELYFQRVGESRLSSPVTRFRHAEGATVMGTVVPGTRTVVAIAEMGRARDPSWAAALIRLQPGREPVVLADRVNFSTRPLVTAGGRVFVQRGQAGPEPTLEQARAGELRNDRLTLDEVDLETGRSRTVHAITGYIAFLAGSLGDELFAYRVSFRRADLVAVNADSGAVRVLAAPIPPFARDFSVDVAGAALQFTQLDPATGAWQIERLEVKTLRRSVLARGSSMALAAHSWPGGGLAFNPEGEQGLHVLGNDAVAKAPLGKGVDFIRALSRDAAFATGLHTLTSELSRPFVLRTRTGEPLLLAHPAQTRIEVAGFVERSAP